MKKLNNYSQRFATVFFQFFPEWKEFLSVDAENDTKEDGCLLVKIRAPAKGLLPETLLPSHEDFLMVTSADDEITVAFNYYHNHFDMFAGDTNFEAEEFQQAAEFVQSIIEEKTLVAVILDGNEWRGSTTVGADEKLDLSNWPGLTALSQDVYVRSWHGTYNRKFSFTE